MKKSVQAFCVGSLLAGTLSFPVVAQTTGTDTNPPLTSSTSTATELKVTPRVGIGYTTSGGGYDGFSRLEGFIPLQQTPGSNLTFLEGRLLLDDDANFGGNILLGHRIYSPSSNRIFGGYLAYDNRNTGNSIFNQIGAGFETIGDVWDFRANAYLPIGGNRKLVDESTFDTGFQATADPFFQDHFLIIEGQQQRSSIRRYEAATAGFDIEAGAKLAQLGSQGDLRGYAGLYYYNPPGTDDTFGWRLRLEARPTDTLNLGLSLQDDRIFGTNLLLSVGATFPGTRPRGVTKPPSVVARMGE